MGYSAPAFGVLSTGFVKKLTGDIELDITGKLRANVDPNLDLSPTEPLGQTVSAFSAELAEAWEALETVYNANDPSAAEGMLLYNVGLITGTQLIGATKSRVVVTCNLGASASIPVGTQANVLGQPSNLWQLLGPGTSTTNFTLGALTSTTAGNYSAVFESTTTGPNQANAGTLTVITAGSVSGLNSITNPADAVPGTNTETDADFRTRRDAELAASGASTVDAIRAALLEITGVKNAFVFENTTDSYDSAGRPPHSIEAVIFDGVTPDHTLDNTIAQTLWENKPGGIPFFSATGDNGIATDSQQNPQRVAFSRVQVVEVYSAYTITTGTGWDAVNGPAAVKAAAQQYATDNLNLGSAVIALELRAVPLGPLSKYAVQGVTDVTALALDVVASPTATANLVMTTRQYPHIQTTHITVNGV